MFYLFRNYKDYGKYIKDWTIEPEKDANATAYWQRIFGKLECSLAEEYNCNKNPNTPSGWKEITVAMAMESLDALR